MTSDEQELFKGKKEYIYSIFCAMLLTDKGKALV
jgi:hypothetical protein